MAAIPNAYRRVVLVRRPPGEPAESDSRVEEVPVPEPGRGELVRDVYISLDPYMRGRMRDTKSYAAPVEIGEVMTGGTVGEVVASNHPDSRWAISLRIGWAGRSTASAPVRPRARSIRRSPRSRPPTVSLACPA